MSRDPRIDAYIEKSAPFAQPILKALRTAVHAGCPDVVETIKWGMPFFDHDGPLCFMAGFKAHCGFGFWKPTGVMPQASDEAMGQLGRLTSKADLPARKALVQMVRDAVEAKKSAPIKPKPKAAPRPVLVPPMLAAALARDAKARTGFEGLSPSKRRDYTEWISEAKAEATRERRLAQALGWLAEGKSRHWKHETPAKR